MNKNIHKKVFVGIDVHKKTYSLSAVCNQEIIKKCTMPADPFGLLSFLHKTFKGSEIITAYEAGFSGFALQRFLSGNGVTCLVVHPASIEIASRERVKTDKRDSLKIAVQLSSGRLKSVFIPEKQREDFRILTRLRNGLAKDKAKKGTQLKALLYQLGKIKHDDRFNISLKWIHEVLSMGFSPDQYIVIKSICDQWIYLANEIKKIDQELVLQAQRDKKLHGIYSSIPGFGPVVSRVMANELGDMSQFANERQLFSYTGLTPREYSSGEHRRLGHISKPLLRKMLVQATWKAILVDEGLLEIYSRISLKRGKKRAIVAVARRLIGRARKCIKSGNSYSLRRIMTSTTPW